MDKDLLQKAERVGRLQLVSELQDWMIKHQEDLSHDFRKEFYLYLTGLASTLTEKTDSPDK